MKTKEIWANLIVSDLDRTTQFYSNLGFELNGTSNDLTSFSVGNKSFVINFFLKEVLESNIKVEMTDLRFGSEVVFTLSADSKEEVDEWEKEVVKAGGTIVSPAEEFGPGYYGFVFADPDGHKFNVFYM
jgi:hypothetical protein